MGSFFSRNQGVKYILCVMDVFTKNDWIEPWKDKKVKSLFHGFVEIVHKSERKPNKLRFDQEK